MPDLEGEFMHGFGICMVGLRASALDMVTALYPRHKDILEPQLPHSIRSRVRERPFPYERFIRATGQVTRMTDALATIVETKAQTLTDPSDLFTATRQHVQAIDSETDAFDTYLETHTADTYREDFTPYIPSLATTCHSIDETFSIMKQYEGSIDGMRARMRWVASEPRFNDGTWSP